MNRWVALFFSVTLTAIAAEKIGATGFENMHPWNFMTLLNAIIHSTFVFPDEEG